MSAVAAYLDNLNPEQRLAVEHGCVGPGPAAPLLVIAGAGSGKTNTLAHRVAHLIVSHVPESGRSNPRAASPTIAANAASNINAMPTAWSALASGSLW